jgi:hypothetical protein
MARNRHCSLAVGSKISMIRRSAYARINSDEPPASQLNLDPTLRRI